MAKVFVAAVSVDGYIADDNDEVGPLFDWFDNGDVASAVDQAEAVAGDRTVSVSAGDIGGQALAAGVVDEVHMNVVPVVFGSGRKFFGGYEAGKLLLDDPRIIQGDRVVHTIYPVRAS